MNQHELRKQITEQIVKALEGNVIPWRKPWSSSPNAGRPANIVSRKPYSGVNPHLLRLHQLRFGFSSRWYGTFPQWKAAGFCVSKRPADVRQGEWGCQIVFARPITRTTVDKETGEEVEESFHLLRFYTVFSADQVEGADEYRVQAESDDGHVPDFEPAEELVQASGADIHCTNEDRAYYKRPTPFESWPNHSDGDYIVMPHRSNFNTQVDWYSTLFHELGHFCEVRTGWDHRKHGYGLGELASEMAGCFLATELGVPQSDDRSNHIAYLKSWLDSMKGDPSFIFKASSQASKVCDYLLARAGRVIEPEPVGAGQEE
jgi:antirestriction protein ArdC